MDDLKDRFTRAVSRLLSLALAVLAVFLAANSNQPDVTLAAGPSQMYWTDAGTDKIQRANLNGASVQDVVTGLSNPMDIALDVSGGKMYWTELGGDKIQRANLDGTSIQNLVTAFSPVGIALDVSGGKMYWVTSYKIQRANLDGTSIEDLVTTGFIDTWGIALDIQPSTPVPVPAASQRGLIALAAALVVVFVWSYMRKSALLPSRL